ncbi:MAG: dipicolinate synthase subunit DpsA [Oscillospiraceae bacterium]
MKKKTFLIAGGDLRFIRLAEYLATRGGEVYTMGFDKAPSVPETVRQCSSPRPADYIILPLPVSNDGITVNTPYSDKVLLISDIISAAKTDVIFGGRFPCDISDLLAHKGMTAIDYSAREEFAVLNAVATAEGAIQVIMEETASTIMGQKILIVGMGRIAKALMRALSGFGADITAAARKCSDRAWAEVYGCKNIKISDLHYYTKDFDIIINTVPAMIFDRSLLSELKKDCLVVDLASKPGGVDFEAAAQHGIRALWLLSLPGKAAPLTAGETIGRTIINILDERGELDGT